MRGAGSTAMRRTASSDRLAGLGLAAAPAATPPARQRQGLLLCFRGYRLGLRVPSEMWGATSLALRLAQPAAGAAGFVPPPHRSASVLAQAFSTAASEPPPAGPVSEDNPKSLAAALEWRPQLGAAEDWACLLGSAAVCLAVYAVTAPATVRPLYAACMGVFYLLLVAVTRTWLLEQRYRAVQRSERELAGSDSRFFELDGIHLHYKRHTPTPKGLPWSGGAGSGAVAGAAAAQAGDPPAAVVHCLHGFGASCYSWSFVQQDLADALRAVVTSHDMPGFGLTQRPRDPRYYTMHFNGDASRAILDAEVAGQLAQQELRQRYRQQRGPGPLTGVGNLQQWGEGREAEGYGNSQQGGESLRSYPLSSPGASPSPSRSASSASLSDCDDAQPQRAQRTAPWRVLIGHSMGGAAAAEGVISHPEGVDALVLVAPAIVGLWLGPPEEAAGDPVATGLAVVEEIVSAEDAPGELRSLSSSPSGSRQRLARSNSASSTSSGGGSGGGTAPQRARRAARAAAAVLKSAALLLVRLALLAATPLMVLLLRRLVRARRFWERGLASAWHDSQRVTREYVDAYRSGQLVRGWEGGILRFLSARFAEKHGFWHSVREAFRGDTHLTQAERLAAAVRRHGIRVLIIHGASDALVPAANSRRLAALLPNAELVVFEGCGHMPQEECPERFVQTVQRFLGSLEAEKPAEP